MNFTGKLFPPTFDYTNIQVTDQPIIVMVMLFI